MTLSALLLALVVLLIFQLPARDGEPDHLHRNIGAPSVELGEDNALLDAALDRTRHLPLDRIGHEQVLPAMSAAVSLSRNRIDAVARESDPASWADTARTLEHAGQPVARASALFHALKQLNGDPAWRELEAPVAELLNDYALHVRRHPDLLSRLQSTRTAGPLTPDSEEQRLNELTYLRLSDHGLGLDADQRERFSRNEQTLSELADLFRLNLRQSTGRYELLLASRQQLDGLPPNAIARARRDASVRGHEQSWALTLGTHSRFDVLRFSPDRELRRTIYTAWERRAAGRSHGSRGNQAELMRRILELRTEQAVLLGHTDHWQRVLAHGSVRSSSRLQSIFDVIIAAARTGAEREIAAITDHLRATGQAGPPQPWDWWYYRERSGVDVEAVSEWFELESVRDSAFALAEVLWGVSFRPAPDLPVWHADAEAFVVDDINGQRLGVVYLDLINRRGKSGGAWMSILRPASAPAGPVVVAAANFEARSTHDPILLTPHQVETVYHELGHAVHVLLSEVDRPSLTAPRLADDFVEVPALIFERFALHPMWLARHARHFQSDQPLRPDQIAQLASGRCRLGGLATLQLLSAIVLDQAWHQTGFLEMDDPEAIERELRQRNQWPAIITPRAILGDYSELFAQPRGGTSYRRLWADVLAADAFAAVAPNGVIDRERALALRRELLAPANRRDPMLSWQRFRGRPPDPIHWLRERQLAD